MEKRADLGGNRGFMPGVVRPLVAASAAALLHLTVMAGGAPSAPVRLDPLVSHMAAPTAVAAGADGSVCVAESSRNRVVLFDAAGSHLGTLEGLSRPVSVAMDAGGRIYVGNAGRGSVEVYGPGLELVFRLGQGDGEFGQPNGIAVSADGTAYVADGREDAVKIYGADGSPLGTLGSPPAGERLFSFPTSLALDDAAGELIVVDLPLRSGSPGARVQVLTLEGTVVRSFGQYGLGEGMLVRPLGVATGPEGRVYVSDAYQNVVQVFGRDGAWQSVIHDEEEPLRTPMGLAYSAHDGRLYVASLNRGRVEVFDLREPARSVRLSVATAGTGAGTVVSTPAGISCPGACTADFPPGSTVALKAGAAAGSAFGAWEGDCGGAGDCALTLDTPRAVTARFETVPRGSGARSDFDGDGRSDVLWLDPSTGAVTLWLLGPGLRPETVPGGAAPCPGPWRIGEANGDGRADVLWRDRRSGALSLWLMEGGRVAAHVGVPAVRGPRWELSAFADFDGDRRADVLWRRRATGELALWRLEGAAAARRTRFAGPRGRHWSVAAAADFNGDGRADLLWRDRARGALAIWVMSGPARIGTSVLCERCDADGRIAGVGDFDGDGTADILRRRSPGGAFTLWRVRDAAVRAESPVPVAAGPDWEVLEVGDFDGDRRADLLLADPEGGEAYACVGDGAGAMPCVPLGRALGRTGAE